VPAQVLKIKLVWLPLAGLLKRRVNVIMRVAVALQSVEFSRAVLPTMLASATGRLCLAD